MKIFVKAKPAAEKEEILKIDETHYMISVKAPATDGKSNRAIIKVLARHFDVGVSCVNILSGHTSRQKIVEIL
ncbi:MAG: DUF167 domain-containing protein [Spirochaetota bacterium]